MALDTLVFEIKQLPLVTRLALVEIIAESVRQELAEGLDPTSGGAFARGLLQSAGELPSDQELKDDYIDYLIQKYK